MFKSAVGIQEHSTVCFCGGAYSLLKGNGGGGDRVYPT